MLGKCLTMTYNLSPQADFTECLSYQYLNFFFFLTFGFYEHNGFGGIKIVVDKLKELVFYLCARVKGVDCSPWGVVGRKDA